MILVAGNDADLLFVLSYGLRRRGYEVVAAPLAEAMARLGEGGKAELVLIDDAAPDRRVLAPPIVTRPGGPPVPRVLLTARALDPAVGISLGWAAVVPKPFLLADLVRVIEALGVSGRSQTLRCAEQPGQPDRR